MCAYAAANIDHERAPCGRRSSSCDLTAVRALRRGQISFGLGVVPFLAAQWVTRHARHSFCGTLRSAES